jgi:hypothetical protein
LWGSNPRNAVTKRTIGYEQNTSKSPESDTSDRSLTIDALLRQEPDGEDDEEDEEDEDKDEDKDEGDDDNEDDGYSVRAFPMCQW